MSRLPESCRGHVLRAEGCDRARRREHGPVVAAAERDGDARGPRGIHATPGHVDASLAKLVEDEPAGGVVAHHAHVGDTEAKARGRPLETIPPDPPSASVPASASRSVWPKARLDRLSRDDRVRVEVPDHHEVEAISRHHWPTAVAAGIGVSFHLCEQPLDAGALHPPGVKPPELVRRGSDPQGGCLRQVEPTREPCGETPGEGIATSDRVHHPVAGSVEVERPDVSHKQGAAPPEAEPHGTRAALEEPLGERGQRAERRVAPAHAAPPSSSDSSARFGLTTSGPAPRASSSASGLELSRIVKVPHSRARVTRREWRSGGSARRQAACDHGHVAKRAFSRPASRARRTPAARAQTWGRGFRRDRPGRRQRACGSRGSRRRLGRAWTRQPSAASRSRSSSPRLPPAGATRCVRAPRARATIATCTALPPGVSSASEARTIPSTTPPRASEMRSMAGLVAMARTPSRIRPFPPRCPQPAARRPPQPARRRR